MLVPLLKQLKTLNTALNNLETLAAVSEPLALPTHLEIDFSSKCNLRCPMCHQAKLDMGNYRLAAPALSALIDSLPYRQSVMIAGLGEPLLYKDLAHFLPYLQRYGCLVHLFTNGQLIDKRLPLLLGIQRVSVSFDGATANTFERLRKGASFARVTNNIALLRQAAPRMRLVTSTVVSNANLHEVADIVALAAKLKMDEVHLSPVDHTPALALGPEHASVFAAQLTRAHQIAKQANIGLYNNIGDQHFVLTRNSKISTQDYQLADNARSDIESENDSPHLTEAEIAVHRQAALAHIHGLDAEAERDEIKHRIQTLRTALDALRAEVRAGRPLALPYCSAPWQYAFARSTGQARLCPYADLDVGSVANVLSGPYQSPMLNAVRQSFANQTPELAVCRNCTDDHRHFKRRELSEALLQESATLPSLKAMYRRLKSRLLTTD